MITNQTYQSPSCRMLCILLCLIAQPLACAQRSDSNTGQELRVVELAKGLDHPWGMAFLPGGDLLITERSGKLLRFYEQGEKPTTITGTPRVYASGQGGLLDVAVHPKFSSNQRIYLSYAARGKGGAGTEVVSARLLGNKLTDSKVVFSAAPKTAGRAHYGSRLLFDGNQLYITLGDRYSHKEEAQNSSNHLGTVVRINGDGSIPANNPLIRTEGARPEIFSYGHRNVQGIAQHPTTGQIWIHEHGPKGGDEVNILRAGANYGWPAITYGIDYSGAIISDKTAAPSMEQPVVYWDPSIAPSGMAFYQGVAFPQWQGNLFVGALAGRHLRRLVLDGNDVAEQHQLLTERDERVRDVKASPDGFLYVLTDSSNGKLLRLEPATGANK